MAPTGGFPLGFPILEFARLTAPSPKEPTPQAAFTLPVRLLQRTGPLPCAARRCESLPCGINGNRLWHRNAGRLMGPPPCEALCGALCEEPNRSWERTRCRHKTRQSGAHCPLICCWRPCTPFARIGRLCIVPTWWQLRSASDPLGVCLEPHPSWGGGHHSAATVRSRRIDRV